MSTLNITVPDMACGACADTITKAVQSLDPSAKVETDLDSKAVKISSSINEFSLTQAIQKAGYTVQQ
jgi:copper chaperone